VKILINPHPFGQKYYNAGECSVDTELRGACLEIVIALDAHDYFEEWKKEIAEARATPGVNEQLWSREMLDTRRALEDLDGCAARNLLRDHLRPRVEIVEIPTVTEEQVRKRNAALKGIP
jgi:hypothetical protein